MFDEQPESAATDAPVDDDDAGAEPAAEAPEPQAVAEGGEDAGAEPAAEAPEPQAAAEGGDDGGADAATDAEGDEEPGSVAPEVSEYIGQGSTVVHATHEEGRPIKSPFRTPPGIAGGLDPGDPEDRT